MSDDEYLAASGKLTRQAVRDAIDKLRGPVVHRVCGNFDYHVVHPKAQGWTLCANCFTPVFVAPVHEETP